MLLQLNVIKLFVFLFMHSSSIIGYTIIFLLSGIFLEIEHKTNPELYQHMAFSKMPVLSCQALCSDFTKDIGYHIMKQYCPSCMKSD